MAKLTKAQRSGAAQKGAATRKENEAKRARGDLRQARSNAASAAKRLGGSAAGGGGGGSDLPRRDAAARLMSSHDLARGGQPAELIRRVAVAMILGGRAASASVVVHREVHVGRPLPEDAEAVHAAPELGAKNAAGIEEENDGGVVRLKGAGLAGRDAGADSSGDRQQASLGRVFPNAVGAGRKHHPPALILLKPVAQFLAERHIGIGIHPDSGD